MAEVTDLSEEDTTFILRAEVVRTEDRLVSFGGLVSECIDFIASCGIQENATLA
jgi:hypothetical protein